MLVLIINCCSDCLCCHLIAVLSGFASRLPVKYLDGKIVSEVNYSVSSVTLNPTVPLPVAIFSNYQS